MKKMLKFSALLLGLALILGLTGCPPDGGDPDPYADDYKSDPNGTVEIVNNTSFDMLLFAGEEIGVATKIGGVRSGTRRNLDVSSRSDFQVGGYMLLRAVKQSEYDTYKGQSRVDYTAMVTYGEGKKFTTSIVSTTDGDYQYTVYNRSRDYGLELRKNSPEGEKVAYLTKGEVRRVLRSPNSAELTLYPVWVAFNNQTKSIVTFTPADTLSALDIQPKRATEDAAPYYFPLGGTAVNITFPNVNLPFATIFVRNNANLNANFRISNEIKTPESHYTGITSGARESYEIRSTGEGLNLNLAMSQGNIVVPVRFESAPTASTVTIENGFVYTVSLELKAGGDPAQTSDYTAYLVKGSAINTSDLLVSN
ncbi:hypothetical protein AGMMS49991_02780 [Spirochaetia bacterium]|nr:hypothetical protein AGMMS49991_02780 [Spirochaetia bacterium]